MPEPDQASNGQRKGIKGDVSAVSEVQTHKNVELCGRSGCQPRPRYTSPQRAMSFRVDPFSLYIHILFLLVFFPFPLFLALTYCPSHHFFSPFFFSALLISFPILFSPSLTPSLPLSLYLSSSIHKKDTFSSRLCNDSP